MRSSLSILRRVCVAAFFSSISIPMIACSGSTTDGIGQNDDALNGKGGQCGPAVCAANESCCEVPDKSGFCTQECIAGPCPGVPCKLPPPPPPPPTCGGVQCLPNQHCCDWP